MRITFVFFERSLIFFFFFFFWIVWQANKSIVQRRNDTHHNDIQHNVIQQNNTQLKGLICETQHKWRSAEMTLSKTTLFYYAECHYAECHYAECQILFIMLNVVMLSDIMLKVIARQPMVENLKERKIPFRDQCYKTFLYVNYEFLY